MRFILAILLLLPLASVAQSMSGGAMAASSMGGGVMQPRAQGGEIGPPPSFTCRYKPSELTAIYSDLDPIASWTADTDSIKGTSECNLSQSTSTAKPTYHASCASFGGSPCADFDGGDYVDVAGAFAATVPLPFSVCFASKETAAGVRSIVSTNVTTWGYLAYTSTATTQYYFDATPTAVVDNFTSTSNVLSSPNSGCMTMDASGDTLFYLDKASAITGSLPGHTREPNGIVMGGTHSGGSPLIGQMAELIMYPRKLSAAEVTRWYAHTCTDYGLGC